MNLDEPPGLCVRHVACSQERRVIAMGRGGRHRRRGHGGGRAAEEARHGAGGARRRAARRHGWALPVHIDHSNIVMIQIDFAVSARAASYNVTVDSSERA